MPTLVVMAAGLGSRYGSAKQIARVGPSGEMLLDYAVFDAHRAGFRRVVFVISGELTDLITARANVFPTDMCVRWVIQDADALPPGSGRPPARARPWGTVHAVLAAHSICDGPLVALNADDFYGLAAHRLARASSEEAIRAEQTTIVGMRLDTTLSEHGPVIRAVCETKDGWLTRLEEVHGIERIAGDICGRTRHGAFRRFSGAETVSMNLWVLSVSTIRHLAERFDDFLKTHAGEPDAELPLPEAVGELIAGRAIRVRVLEAPGPWFGLTHPADRPRVVAALRSLVDLGEYPEALWPRLMDRCP